MPFCRPMYNSIIYPFLIRLTKQILSNLPTVKKKQCLVILERISLGALAKLCLINGYKIEHTPYHVQYIYAFFISVNLRFLCFFILGLTWWSSEHSLEILENQDLQTKTCWHGCSRLLSGRVQPHGSVSLWWDSFELFCLSMDENRWDTLTDPFSVFSLYMLSTAEIQQNIWWSHLYGNTLICVVYISFCISIKIERAY